MSSVVLKPNDNGPVHLSVKTLRLFTISLYITNLQDHEFVFYSVDALLHTYLVAMEIRDQFVHVVLSLSQKRNGETRKEISRALDLSA